MLTVSQAIPTGTGGTKPYAPWSQNTHPITFASPQLSSVTLIDDDASFDSGRYTPGETQQTLQNDTTFGYGASATTLAAGTRLSSFIGSVLVDDQGNRFVVMFPRTFTSGSNGTELGARTSVLIFPQPREDAPGNVTYPGFDLSRTYRFESVYNVSTTSDGPDYTPSTVPCFTTGTLIETASGPATIETLQTGDLIRTRDNGMRKIGWIGQTALDTHQLDLRPNLRPIRICAGALAPGVPQCDLTVSPQHRILVRSVIAQRMFGEQEILVAAKHLVGLPGIEVICPDDGVTYWHMLFDRHEVVLSNGAWTESLFIGPHLAEHLGAATRREIFALFPQLVDPRLRPDAARRLLNGREGRKLAERHARNARQLVAG